VHRTGAAEREQGEVARVVAALDGDDAQRAAMRTDDLDDAGSGLRAETERRAICVSMTARSLDMTGSAPPSSATGSGN
jgi:hypothetical protein